MCARNEWSAGLTLVRAGMSKSQQSWCFYGRQGGAIRSDHEDEARVGEQHFNEAEESLPGEQE